MPIDSPRIDWLVYWCMGIKNNMLMNVFMTRIHIPVNIHTHICININITCISSLCRHCNIDSTSYWPTARKYTTLSIFLIKFNVIWKKYHYDNCEIKTRVYEYCSGIRKRSTGNVTINVLFNKRGHMIVLLC